MLLVGEFAMLHLMDETSVKKTIVLSAYFVLCSFTMVSLIKRRSDLVASGKVPEIYFIHCLPHLFSGRNLH